MCVCVFCLFETGSRYAAQAGLELTFVAQAGLELTPILLPQPPKYWDYRSAPPHPAYLFIFKYLFSNIMAGSACPGGGAGAACGAGDQTLVPAAASLPPKLS